MIAEAGQCLRAGQPVAWEKTPSHGDVFHVQRQCETLANTLKRLAMRARSQRMKPEARVNRAGGRGRARRACAGRTSLKRGCRP